MTDIVDEKHIMDNIIKDFFRAKGVASIQLDSFNQFINNGIQKTIDEESEIKIDINKEQSYIIKFGTVYVTNASIIDENRTLKEIYPQEARKRDLNYEGAILCDITETLYENGNVTQKTIHNRTFIGRTPIMIGSDKCNLKSLSKSEKIQHGECEWDDGGYFIIRGNDRAVVAQLRGNYNQPVVLLQKETEKYSYIAEIRSMSEETGHSVQLKTKLGTDDKTIVFSLPYIKEHIPVGIVFKALGFLKDEDISNFIGLVNKDAKKYIGNIIKDSSFIKTQDMALEYIGNNSIHVIPKTDRINYASQVCKTELFPHMGICSTDKDICILLGYIINQLLSTKLGIREPDDRDNYANKRVETTGILCQELFRTLFKRYINTIKLQLDKKKSRLDVIAVIRKTSSITQGLNYSFFNW